MKKLTAFILSVLLCCNVFLSYAAGLGNFSVQREANSQTFSDISSSDWFYQDVLSAYAYGLANGMGDGQFSPNGMVSLAEAVTFGARVHQIYNQTDAQFAAEEGEAWYTAYLTYATEQGFVESGRFDAEMTRPATRSEVASIFGKALPQEEYETKNQAVTSIPDMNSSEKDYSECLMLFRAGVLTGKDDQGNFYPAQNITRAEVAAMLNRIIDKTQRKAFTPAQGQTPDDPTPTTPPSRTPMNAEQIAAAAESSVFTVLCYDKDNKLFGSGN